MCYIGYVLPFVCHYKSNNGFLSVVNSLDGIGKKLSEDPISAAIVGKFFLKNVLHDLFSPKKE